MLQAFIFSEVGITVRHWYEIGGNPDEEEHGIRLEVRALRRHSRRGSLAAPQIVELDEILWRADLFDLIGDEPGTFRRAHHHTRFDGIEPLDRAWDDDLSADPLGWTGERLSDISVLAKDAGFELRDPAGETEDVRRHLSLIMAAAQLASPARCQTPDHCLAETRDTEELVLKMLAERRELAGPPRDPRR